MAGIGKYEKGKAFALRSGNKPSFFKMGSSPTKHTSEEAGGVVHYHDKYGKHEEGYQMEDDPDTGKPAGTTTTEEASYAPGVHAGAEEAYTSGMAEFLKTRGFTTAEIRERWKAAGLTYPRKTGKDTEAGIKTMEERGVDDWFSRPYKFTEG